MEENILEKGMIKDLLKKKGKAAPKQGKAAAPPPVPEAPPAPEPTHARGRCCCERGGAANVADAQPEPEESESSEAEAPPAAQARGGGRLLPSSRSHHLSAPTLQTPRMTTHHRQRSTPLRPRGRP